MVVVLCSLEISFIVCKKRSCRCCWTRDTTLWTSCAGALAASITTQTQRAIVRHVAVWREDVDAVEESGVSCPSFQGLRNLCAHFGFVVETTLAVLHLTAQIRARIEPEPGRIIRLVARAV